MEALYDKKINGGNDLEGLKRAILLKRLQQRIKTQPGKQMIGSVPRANRQELPVSYAQQRLWFLDRLDQAAGAAYHMPVGMRLQGSLNKVALRAALDRLVERHESLRTRFGTVDGQTVQRIGAPVGFALSERDLRDLSSGEQAEAIERISVQEAREAFDLCSGPLIRGQLLQLGSAEHILLVTQHHIISDGWSIGIMVREVSALYEAFSQGAADPLPALPIQYADYALWQRQWLQGEVLQSQTKFWQEHLRGAPALLELPTDRPRPAMQSYAGGRVQLEIDAELTEGLRQLSHRHGTTLFMTLLTGWAVVLSRLSGQSEVVIGTPVANRQRREIESLIGFFVNTLALRVRVGAEETVSQVLEQVKSTTLGAYEHQDVPFDQVVEVLQPPRSMSYSPVFQSMMSLNNTPTREVLRLSGLTISAVEAVSETTQFDLSLSVTEQGAGLDAGLSYASDLYERSTIQRYAGYLQSVLKGMVAGAHRRVSDLELMGEPERRRVLHEFNDTAVGYEREQRVPELFEEQVRSRPDAIAVEYEDQQLTYGELNRRANQLAHELRERGVRADSRVALCMERGVEMVVGLLGVLKAGGAYVPLDPAYPAERLGYMLSDSEPVVVLTQQRLLERVSGAGVPVVMLDGAADETRITARPESNPAPHQIGLSSRNLAYVIYTSGSTGLPKGVMVEHRSVSNLWQALAGNVFQHLPRNARVTVNAPISFDSSVKNIAQLLSGHRLVIVPQTLRADASKLVQWLVDQQVDAFDCTPSQLDLMRQAGLLSTERCKGLTVVIGGEAISASLWHDLQRAQMHSFNVYGPTECTVDATVTKLKTATSSPHIGRPISNTRIYILGKVGEPVPIGVTGEIHIGGAGVARGYLNRTELTAERFVKDPFSMVADARMYRTGDLGRWRADGTIEFLGRNDFQVKIRGFRIELGEIEARLIQCEGVKEAVVVARDELVGKRLVAYVTAQPGVELSAAGLRGELSKGLADYMVPSAFVVLESFPLTSNGKLDRKALPRPDQSAVVSQEYEAPDGAVEQALAQIWQELLSVERVGRHDNFFELGGHSLLAVQVVVRARQGLHVEVSLRELFNQPRLSEFARVLREAKRSEQGALVPADRNQELPVSYAQQRLWFLDRLDQAAGAAYHMPVGMRLQGLLNKAALRAALDRLVERHESLRTCFGTVDGQTVQRIGAPVGFALSEQDLRDLSSGEQAEAIERISVQEAREAFDLCGGPLIRGQLLQLGSVEHILLVTQHHIISDGWSIGIMVREVSALYEAFSQGAADPLPALPIQYADYALWQRQWLQGEVLQSQTKFWQEHLRGAPALLELPTDRPRPAMQSYAGGRVQLEIDAELTEGLRQLSHRHGTTLFMTLLTGWAVVLSRLSGQSEVVIGTPVANRQRREIESLIGFFVNTLALRVRVGAEETVSQVLEQVKSATLGAYEHQDVPFDQVVEVLQPPRSMSYSPVFQSMMSLNNTPTREVLRLSGLTISAVEAVSETTQFDLSLSVTEQGAGLDAGLSYASDLYERSTIQRYAGYLQSVLKGMVAGSHRRVSDLELMGEPECRRVLHEFNDTAAPYPQDRMSHELFEEQVRSRPAAIAVEYEYQQLTYEELNRRANQLAHELRERGVRADSRVALCMERGVEMVVGLLGVLKAGGAYVPLDPAYPAERLGYMLSDSEPVVVLTQQRLLERVSGAGVPVVMLDGAADEARIAARPVSNPAPHQIGLSSRNLAYVIYTSGSTGLPKGVMVEHRGLCNLARSQIASFAVDASSRVLQFVSLSFDVSLSEIMMALGSGACLCLAPASALQVGEPLLSTVRRHAISHLTLPKAVLAVLPVEAGLGELHTLITGGEVLPPALAAAWSKRYRLFNSYGPTETTVCASEYRCQGLQVEAVPIGRPIWNTRIYIVDGRGAPVPIGVTGEIQIGGVGVARGYLNREELTAERFVNDPFSAAPDARMYRTGDLARWRADGNIEFLGRNDLQVKIRGFRIEPGEIEARLVQCEGVKEAVVLACAEGAPDTRQGEKRLVAYVTAQPAVQLSAAQLRGELLQVLADYMVPSAFVVLESLPLTPNGKLDREALPGLTETTAMTREYEVPVGEIEEALARIWQELLHVERVGRHDNFFELGGHSLLAVRMLSRVKRKLNVEISLRALYFRPTLMGIATEVSSRNAPASHRSLVPIRHAGNLRPLFLIHPSKGEVGYARALAPHLERELPVYGLAARGLSSNDMPLESVEEMAACYLREIREVQPHGPYRLGGWSSGGIIAYEMANQLVGADEPVEFLGLMDTASDYAESASTSLGLANHCREAANFEAWVIGLAWVPELTPSDIRMHLDTLAREKSVEQILEYGQQVRLFPDEVDVGTLRRHLHVQYAMAVALRRYALPRIPISVALFSAIDERREDFTIGWRKIARNCLKVKCVSGTHHSMMESPHVERLAAELTRELNASRGDSVEYPERQYAPLITIKLGRGGVCPLICVPGAGAPVTAFAALADVLDSRITIYGMQPRGLCGTMTPHIDVPSAARAYVAAIRAAKIPGPYRLLGHSFGGWVVTEMALQLMAAGEQVAAVIVLDSDAPCGTGGEQRYRAREELLVELVRLFEQIAGRSLALHEDDFAPLDHDAQLALLLSRLTEVKLMPPRTTVEALGGIVRTFATNANTDYRPDRQYGGPMYFAAARPAANGYAHAMSDSELISRWSEYAPRIQAWSSEGNHMTMLSDPHLKAMAAWLSPLLA